VILIDYIPAYGFSSAVCLLFLKPGEVRVPLLLPVGGTVLFALLGGTGGGGSTPLHHAPFAGASFSGLATGVPALLGNGEGG
jgi:hypothetical protein